MSLERVAHLGLLGQLVRLCRRDDEQVLVHVLSLEQHRLDSPPDRQISFTPGGFGFVHSGDQRVWVQKLLRTEVWKNAEGKYLVVKGERSCQGGAGLAARGSQEQSMHMGSLGGRRASHAGEGCEGAFGSSWRAWRSGILATEGSSRTSRV